MRLIPAYEVADIANAIETAVSDQYIVGYADSYIYSVDGELLTVNSRSFRYVYFYTYFDGIEQVLKNFVNQRATIYVKSISVSSSSFSSGSQSESRYDIFHSISIQPYPPLFQCNLCVWGGFPCHYTSWYSYFATSSWSSSSNLQFVLEGIDKPTKEVISLGFFYYSTYYPVLRFFRRYSIVLEKLSTSSSVSIQYSRNYSYSIIHCDCPGHPGHDTFTSNFYRNFYHTTSKFENLRDIIENNKYALIGMSGWNEWWASTQDYSWSYFPAGKCINGQTVWGGTQTGNYGCGGYCYTGSRSSSYPQYIFIGCLTDKVR